MGLNLLHSKNIAKTDMVFRHSTQLAGRSQPGLTLCRRNTYRIACRNASRFVIAVRSGRQVMIIKTDRPYAQRVMHRRHIVCLLYTACVHNCGSCAVRAINCSPVCYASVRTTNIMRLCRVICFSFTVSLSPLAV